MTGQVRNRLQLISFIIAVELVGAFGTLFTTPAIPTWYAMLPKPALNPPSWIFGPVWITLYALMGVAAYLVWQKGWNKKRVRKALGVFALQLALNVLWTPVFFGLRSPGLALVVILLLCISIIWTITLFYRESKRAAYILFPYALWVGFATYLNIAILASM